MQTQEREVVIWNGEAFPAPEWLAAIIREQRRELVRRHEERSRRHPAELEDGRTD